MKVLIAVDFSPIGIAVAEHGYLMAKKSGMDAVFFHCAPRVTHMLLGYAGCGAYAALDDAVEQEKIDKTADERLDGIVADVYAKHGEPKGFTAEKCLVSGDPGEEIISYAKKNGFDLIIAGYKSYSTIERILVGSTAAKLVRYAPCSVLVYRVPEHS